MVYDMTAKDAKHPNSGIKGYAIIKGSESDFQYPVYEIYTDDGQGNGDYVCSTSDFYWARLIAQSLDDLNSK